MPELEALGPEDAQILVLEEGPIAGHTMKIAVLARPVALEQVRARVAGQFPTWTRSVMAWRRSSRGSRPRAGSISPVNRGARGTAG